MTEPAPCQQCRHMNPQGNRFCGSCGASLTSGEQLAPRQDHNLVPATRRAWPAKLGPAGKALAVGVAVLAAEVGVSWLRRKIGAEDRSSMPAVRSTGSALQGYLLSQSLEEGLVQIWEEDSYSRIFARREVRSFVTTGSTDSGR
jgi:negative regulator of sigma E activity